MLRLVYPSRFYFFFENVYGEYCNIVWLSKSTETYVLHLSVVGWIRGFSCNNLKQFNITS